MNTPYGQECRYYYEDFNRGRSRQECRLIQKNPDSEAWQPALCRTCPVPGILRANACPHMILEGKIVRRWLGLRRQVQVYAVCLRTAVEVTRPHVGCGECHSASPLFHEHD